MSLTRTAYKVLQQPGAQPAEPAAGAAAGAQPNGIAAGEEEGEDAAGGSSGEGEESEGEEGEDQVLDAFDPEAAAKLEALTEAVQDPGAFLQPSAEVGGPAGGHGGGGSSAWVVWCAWLWSGVQAGGHCQMLWEVF